MTGRSVGPAACGACARAQPSLPRLQKKHDHNSQTAFILLLVPFVSYFSSHVHLFYVMGENILFRLLSEVLAPFCRGVGLFLWKVRENSKTHM